MEHTPPPRSGDWSSANRHLTAGGTVEGIVRDNHYREYYLQLINKRMEQEELKAKVDAIINIYGDPEVAHGREDRLHIEVIEKFCPEWVVKEIKRLSDADFERWCA